MIIDKYHLNKLVKERNKITELLTNTQYLNKRVIGYLKGKRTHLDNEIKKGVVAL